MENINARLKRRRQFERVVLSLSNLTDLECKIIALVSGQSRFENFFRPGLIFAFSAKNSLVRLLRRKL